MATAIASPGETRPVPWSGGAKSAPRSTAATAALRAALLSATVLYLVVVVRTAWISEDAYIALRSVDNFVHGFGLTWNTDERVQTFTCPLWVLLLSAVYYLTREPFYTTIGVSLVCALATAGVVLVYGLRKGGSGALAILALACSKAFTDYSTSGLENPLTHLLLAIFLGSYFADGRPSLRRLGILTLFASLAAVNRFDTILFFLPPLALVWWLRRGWHATTVMVLGLLPLAAWMGFSLFYYGFAFPNTAYAKLHTGIPASGLAQQGLYYYGNSLAWDYVTLPSIALGLAAALGRCMWPTWLATSDNRVIFGVVLARDAQSLKHGAAALGVVLYLIYIVRIGGDFMSGRFFAAPLLASCVLFSFAACRWRPWVVAPIGVAILIAGIWPASSNLKSGANCGLDRPIELIFHHHGIADERTFYFQNCGLLRAHDELDFPVKDWRELGERDRGQAAQVPLVSCCNIGVRCFHGGPRVHYIDYLGLGDPLIARLPSNDPDHWRIGHFERHLPNGYLETLSCGNNRLEDPRLARYYDRLSLIIRGDLFDRRRIREVWRMLRGRYDCLLLDQPRVPPPKRPVQPTSTESAL